jgi:hypothetical protein
MIDDSTGFPANFPSIFPNPSVFMPFNPSFLESTSNHYTPQEKRQKDPGNENAGWHFFLSGRIRHLSFFPRELISFCDQSEYRNDVNPTTKSEI